MTNDERQAYRVFDDAQEQFRQHSGETGFPGASGLLFEQAMAQTRMAICLSDPNKPDSPIAFANRAFIHLTGYDEDEVVGRNCRFLQGPGTDPDAVARIRDALEAEKVIVVELLNYRKDGSTFWNTLHLGPIYDHQGKLVYFFGSQWDVSDVKTARADEAHAKAMARELSHRMKNLFAVISSIVTTTARLEGNTDLGRSINDRIRALSRAFEPTLDEASMGSSEVGLAIRSVLAPYDPGRDRIRLLGNGLRAETGVVSILGLTLHELATNAIKHGALSDADGHVDVDWRRVDGTDGQPDHLLVTWTETGGPGGGGADPSPGTGHGIIGLMLQAAQGEIDYDWAADGLKASLRLPAQAEDKAR